MRKEPVFILLFVFCFSISDSKCQTRKGLWTTGGHFQYEQFQSLGARESTVIIQTELGYAFHGRWMVWGELTIELAEQLSIVGQRLNLRYSFLKLKPVEAYAGLDY